MKTVPIFVDDQFELYDGRVLKVVEVLDDSSVNSDVICEVINDPTYAKLAPGARVKVNRWSIDTQVEKQCRSPKVVFLAVVKERRPCNRIIELNRKIKGTDVSWEGGGFNSTFSSKFGKDANGTTFFISPRKEETIAFLTGVATAYLSAVESLRIDALGLPRMKDNTQLTLEELAKTFFDQNESKS